MTRLAVALCGIAASTAVATTLTHSPTAAQAGDSVALVLADQTFAIAANGPWHAVFDVSGSLDAVLQSTTTTTTTTTTAPPGTVAPATTSPPAESASAEVRVLARRPVTRTELTSVVDGRQLPVSDSVSFPVDAIRSTDGGTDRLTIDVATSVASNTPDALTLTRPGLYPVSVQVVIDGDVVAEHDTFLERLPADGDGDEGASMSVAIVATTPDPGPAATAAELTAGRRQVAQITDVAAAVDGPITVAIPPVLLEGLAAADPALDVAVRSSFDGDEVLAMPADVLDPSSAVAIDEGDAFTRDLVLGEEILDDALTVPATRESGWLAPGEISTDATRLLRNLGFRSLVLTPAVYNGLEGSIGGYLDTTLSIGVALGDDSPFPAMVVDPGATLLDPATLDREGLSPTDAAVHLASWLVTSRRDLGAELPRSVVLLPPDGAVPDPDVAAGLTTFVHGLPGFAMAPLSALPGATDTMVVDERPQIVTLPDTAGPDLSARADRIAVARVDAVSVGSMFLDDDQSVAWNAQLDTLLSTGLDDEQVDDELARIATEADAVLAQVSVPTPFTFTLTGRSSPLRLNIRSSAPVPLQVVVSPSSSKLTFPEGPKLVELNPDGVTEVVIPVEARSNGTSSLAVSVLTPALGENVTAPLVLTARVNAITGLGQVVTGAAVLVLVSWWYGHFRRRRRQRLALVGEVDSPAVPEVGVVSPDAAEATVARPAEEVGADSVSDP